MKKISLLLGICLFVYSFIRLFLPVWADNQSVSLTVPPRASDFQLAIQPDATDTLSQDTTVTYTITYGSHLGYADKITIQASWDQGTINGSDIPSLDGLSYVPGSAMAAYGNVSPVVDLSNNTISWVIPQLPAQTSDQTVQFKLRLGAAYTGQETVNYPIHVHLLATNFTSSGQTITTTYQYVNQNNQSTSRPTTTPTPSGQNASTTSPTQPPTNTQPSTSTQSSPASSSPVQNISLLNVSQSDAQIALTLQNIVKAKVIYGKTPTGLTNTIQADVSGSSGLISLDSLDPDTGYYMQIITTDTSGKTIKSDVFLITTAQASDTPEVSKTSLIIASTTDVLYSPNLSTTSGVSGASVLNQTPQIPLTQNSNYNLTFKLTKANKIKSVTMVIKNTSVLAASTAPTNTNPLEYSYPATQNSSGVFTVQLKNPEIAGFYDAYIRITDFDGNITTQKVAQFHILEPFRVYNATTKQPIEDVRITIYQYNETTKRFELLPDILGSQNPLFTDVKGEASESLSKGVYKANFSSIGYKEQDDITFTVGSSSKDNLPTVYLAPTPITPLSLFTYYKSALFDYLGLTQNYILSIQASNRFFDLFGLGTIFCFVVLGFLLFTMKSHLSFSHIPFYLHYHTLRIFHAEQSCYMHGTVIDKNTHLPISLATVFLINEKTNQVHSKTTTDKAGTFLIPCNTANQYAFFVMKEGYEPSEKIGYQPNIVVPLVVGENFQRQLMVALVGNVQNALALSFEFMLVISVLLELIAFPFFGIWKTMPFFALSLLNIATWGFYLHERGKALS